MEDIGDVGLLIVFGYEFSQGCQGIVVAVCYVFLRDEEIDLHPVFLVPVV